MTKLKLLTGFIALATLFFFNSSPAIATNGWWGCTLSSPINVTTGNNYVVSYYHTSSVNNISVGYDQINPDFWMRYGDPLVWSDQQPGAWGPKIRFYSGEAVQAGINNNDSLTMDGQLTLGANTEVGFLWTPPSDFSLDKIEFFSSEPGVYNVRLWNSVTDTSPIAECGGDSGTPTYQTCSNNACVTIVGVGISSCTTDIQCQPIVTHKECQNNACVVINGAGSDTCTDNTSCQAPPSSTPTANAGGPYTGIEGSPVTFDGSNSTDTGGTLVSYDWDFGASGVNAQHTWSDNFEGNVTLTVTDNNGKLATASAAVSISNANPVVEAGNDISVTVGQAINLNGSYTDAGSLDSHTITWDFGDATTPVTGSLTPTHLYDQPGSYTVTMMVADDDNGIGTDTLVVEVKPIQIQASCVDFRPQTLRLTSQGGLVTVYFSLPTWLDIQNIDSSSVKINGVPALYVFKKQAYFRGYSEIEDEIEDRDDNKEDLVRDESRNFKNGCRMRNKPYAKAKFSRRAVQATLTLGPEVPVNLTGRLLSGAEFSGVDTIRVTKTSHHWWQPWWN